MIGRLTKDADIRVTSGNEPLTIASFTLAVDRKKQNEADFISCKAFGKTAQFIEKYLSAKGSKIVAEGRIQTGSYEKDGRKVYTTDVIVESVEFGESKRDGAAQPIPSSDDGFMNIPDGVDDEELPF